MKNEIRNKDTTIKTSPCMPYLMDISIYGVCMKLKYDK